MKLSEILTLTEGAFDSMVDQLSNAPPKGRGKGRPASGKKTTTGSNYSGERSNVGTPVKRKKSLDQLKGPGPSRIKKVRE